jgi:predicted phosphate transport protein (TIGR00153 family)
MATTNPLAKLLKRSPFKALQQHMRVVLECVRCIPALFDALIDGDEASLNSTKEAIFKWENEADDVKNNLRAHLPKSLFMPVDRRDVLEILQEQDSIADTAQDIAGLLMERPMEVPQALQDPVRTLVRRCVDTCEKSALIIEELDELLETGFRGRQVDKVESMLDELGNIEGETDQLGLELTRTLFQHEEQMSPVSVMLWYRLIEWIGDLADHAEKVGNRLRLLIAS